MRAEHSRRKWKRRVRKLQVELLEDRRLLTAAGELRAPNLYSQLAIDASNHRTTSLLVQFRPEASAADVAAAEAAGTELGDAWQIAPGLREVDLDPGTDYLTALAAYKQNPNVLFVEPDFKVSLNLIPGDPSFGSLWGMHNTAQTGGVADADIDAPEAWDVTTGSSSVIVAIIDTGVDYTHPDLAGNIWTNLAEASGQAGVDDDGNGYVDDIHGYDFVNDDGDPKDDHFHGTHVAGTIGAVGDNGIGVAGVAWDVQIMALKFLDASGGGYTSDAIEALNYAVANGASISNNSWGGGEYSAAFLSALNNAAENGHIFVAAAGNSGSNNDTSPAYPANFPVDNVVSVAASDSSDNFAYFSNIGPNTVDLTAPGVDIRSTFPTYTTSEMSSNGFSRNYETISGTSMAAPHVSGVLALIRSLHPDWSYDQVIGQLLGTVDPVDSLSQTITGGRLNAAGAVGNPPADTTPPRVTSSDPSGGVNGAVSQMRLRFSEPIAAGSFDLSDIVSFVGPQGPIAVNSVDPVPGNSRQYDITFETQTAEGAYSLVIGPQISDLAGNAMTSPYTAGFSIVGTLLYQSTDVPAPINDWTAVGSYLTVDQPAMIGDLNVRLSISHTYDADLAIYLISPSGDYTFLSYFRGGSGNDFQDTLFDDEAAIPIASGSAPFAGAYQPDTSLSVYDGDNAQGVWQLWIEDWGYFDTGSLNSWSIEISPPGVTPPTDPPPPPPPPDPPPDPPPPDPPPDPPPPDPPPDPPPPDPPPPPPPPPVNHAPVAANDFLTANEDQSFVVAVSQLLANDSDPDGDPLTVSAVGNPSGVSVTLLGNGTINVTPNSNFNGSASFSYTIQDGRGLSAVGQVSLNILPVNDPPVAVADSFTGTSGQAVIIQPSQLLANDSDVDGNTLTVVGVSGAFGGSVSLAQNGQITFTPTAGFTGAAGFQYTISDGTTTASAGVTITLQATGVEPGDYYFSLTDAATLTNSDGTTFSVADEDIVRLRVQSNGSYRYTMYFDGSDVGLTTDAEDIDAFYLEPNGALMFSTVGDFSVPDYSGPLTGTGSDVLAFYPGSLGTNTAGSWWVQFSSEDLTLSAENIDAIGFDQDWGLILSTTGNFSVPGLSGTENDFFLFDFTLSSMWFDGSDVGLSTADEDLDGLFVQYDSAGGMPAVYLSTRGDFSVTGASGANEDILRFTPNQLGPATSGSFNLALDGSGVGLAGLDLDGIHMGVAPWEHLVTGAGASSSSSGVSSAGTIVPGGKTGGVPLKAAPVDSPIVTPGDSPISRNPSRTSPIPAPVVEGPAAPPVVQRRETPSQRAAANVPQAAAVDHLLEEWVSRRSTAKDDSHQPQAAKRAAPEPSQVVVVDGISPLLSRGRKR